MPFDKFIRKLINQGIMPGISILVGKGENIVFEGAFGYKSIKPGKEINTKDTIYDTASLTKPLVTALGAVYLMEKGVLSLEDKVGDYLPGFPFDIKVCHLLTHTSGLPAWYPFYLFGEEYLHRFEDLKLESRPGRQVNYSCVGYILLYYIIQKAAGAAFGEFVKEAIFKPLGLKRTFLGLPGEFKQEAAPTEDGNLFEKKMAEKDYPQPAGSFQWRDYMIRGETHDGNSFYQGGTAGNAGLFSTCRDLFILTREFFPSTCSLLAPESTGLFWKNFTPFKKSHRTIGFKLNSSLSTSGGRALSRQAIGHNGFTGTSLWLEPGKGYKYILLANRVHPRVTDYNFNKTRRKLHHLLKGELGLT